MLVRYSRMVGFVCRKTTQILQFSKNEFDHLLIFGSVLCWAACRLFDNSHFIVTLSWIR